MTDINRSVGNQNRYTFWCDFVEQRRFYGACLHLTEAFKNEQITAESDCGKAISCGRCKAVDMREEEIGAAKSIYFTERTIVAETSHVAVDKNSDSYKRGWNQVGDSLSGKSAPKPEPGVKVEKRDDDSGIAKSQDLGDLITLEIDRESKVLALNEKLKSIKAGILLEYKRDIKSARALLLEAKQIESELSAISIR